MALTISTQPKEAQGVIDTIRDYIRSTSDGADWATVKNWIDRVDNGEPAEPIIDMIDWISYCETLRPLGLKILEELSRLKFIDLVRSAGRRMYFHLSLSIMAKIAGTTIRENILGGVDRQFKTIEINLAKFHPDINMTVFPDFSIIAEIFGGKAEIPEDQIPMVVEHPIKSKADLSKLQNMDMNKAGRYFESMKTTQLLAERYTFIKAAGAIAPFTFAGLLMGAEDIARKTIKEPDLVKEVLDFCVEMVVGALQNQIAMGADVVFIGDPTASLLSPKAYQTFAGHYSQKVIEQINRPVILHICGNTNRIIEDMCATGAHGISVDQSVDLPSIKNRVPSDVVIIGNLSPVGTLMTGKPEEVRVETKELLDRMQDVPNYILATGCDIAVESPIENIEAMLDTVKNYG